MLEMEGNDMKLVGGGIAGGTVTKSLAAEGSMSVGDGTKSCVVDDAIRSEMPPESKKASGIKASDGTLCKLGVTAKVRVLPAPLLLLLNE